MLARCIYGYSYCILLHRYNIYWHKSIANYLASYVPCNKVYTRTMAHTTIFIVNAIPTRLPCPSLIRSSQDRISISLYYTQLIHGMLYIWHSSCLSRAIMTNGNVIRQKRKVFRFSWIVWQSLGAEVLRGYIISYMHACWAKFLS